MSTLVRKLKNYRQKKAEERRIGDRVYMIFSNETIDEIVAKKPQTKLALLGCKGIGPQKYNDFGEDIIKIVNDYCGSSVLDNSPRFLPDARSRADETWSQSEKDLVTNSIKSGVSLKTIAALIGRSEFAVQMFLDHPERH